MRKPGELETEWDTPDSDPNKTKCCKVKHRKCSGSVVETFAWETGENHGNFYPSLVDVSAEIRTEHIQTTGQALLLDRTCLCNQEGVCSVLR